MKKLFVLFAAAMLTASASAQGTAVTSSKFGDNWYAGINAGIATYPKEKFGDDGFFKSLAPEFGVRIGKNLTTVFGLALDANMYFKGNEAMGIVVFIIAMAFKMAECALRFVKK